MSLSSLPPERYEHVMSYCELTHGKGGVSEHVRFI